MKTGKDAAAELVLGVIVAAIGVGLLVGGRGISFGAGYDRIGPRFFPFAIGAGLILLGALLAISPWIARKAKQVPPAEPIDWLPLALLVAALVLDVLLLDRAGFVIASVVQFWLAARAFKSRRPLRDAFCAVVVSITIYWAFSRGLGLTLPAGIFADIF